MIRNEIRNGIRNGVLPHCNGAFGRSLSEKIARINPMAASNARSIWNAASQDSPSRWTRVIQDSLAVIPICALSSILIAHSFHRHILAEEKLPTQQEYEDRIKEVLAHAKSNKDVNRLEKTRSIKSPIYRIVLTGGPCGGKSSSLSMLSDRLRSLGFQVFIVPEGATIVITGGGMWKNYGDFSYDQSLAFEGSLMKTKMALEDAFYQLAESTGEPSVIICDRGTMDTAAYLSQEAWEVLCDEFNWNVMDLRDRRYDAVIHLVTAAIGASKYYTTENNTARRESLEEAMKLDLKILEAWVGHPAVRIIDNSTDFAGKLKKVLAQVCQVVGAPKPVNYKRKYLIENGDSVHIPVRYEQFEVEFTYLIKADDTNGYTFIKRRGQNGSYHYSYSVLREVPGEAHEKAVLERMITGREYIALMKQSDPQRITVKKKVKCFVWNNQYYILNTFIEPDIGLSVLECEASDSNSMLMLPDWLNAGKEVTDDSIFTTFQVAKHLSHPDKMPVQATQQPTQTDSE